VGHKPSFELEAGKMKMVISIAIAMLFLVGTAQASPCPTDPNYLIEDPDLFEWDSNNEGTIEIGEASFIMNNGETLDTRAYRQPGVGSFSIPGPTMLMNPGETYVLTFKNSLEFREPTHEENKLKDPDVSNIHTHGLHISGDSPGDDVTRLINGGMCGDYVYKIQGDHMGGHNWYHPHHHGSTNLQVAGGALGNIIINDANDNIPTGVDQMTDRLLTVALLNPGQVAGDGGDTVIGGTLDSAWTTNGIIDGNLCMPQNEWQHWRVLVADIDAKMKNVEIGPECDVMLMARDGVWRTEAPLNLSENGGNLIELTGASRADLAVRCRDDATLMVDREVVANIYADGVTAKPDVGPFSGGATGGTWNATRPTYLKDLRFETTGIEATSTDSISVGARSLYGQAFDGTTPIFDLTPNVYEWSLGANNHPFHLHIYHQQVQGACSGGAFEDGEFYDTISGSCDIRFDTRPEYTTSYNGITIMHCHILKHEDQGAMGWARAVDMGFDAEPFPNEVDYSLLYEQDEFGNCVVGAPICVPTPGQEETETFCTDGVDNDCDGLIDELDTLDCPGTPSTCDAITNRDTCDAEPTCEWQGGKKGECVDLVVCTPTGPEGPYADPLPATCTDGIDNDCNGDIDEADAACQPTVDCGDFTDRKSCRAANSCTWNKNAGVCE
jgi:FtsP/CotA-like multicopper oxidase with cupredoxin domain